ncbi:hypothetical protein ACF3NG_10055 [Aerococcaceae bacterium WGS1372]
MAENKIKLNKTTFKEKFEATIYLIPDHQQNMAIEYIEELSFMRSIMDSLKIEIAKTGATSVFENGKQVVNRQTPELKAYLDVTNRYNQFMKQLLALYPTEEEEATDELSQFLKAGAV